MRQFKDRKDRTWSVEVNVTAIGRVRTLAGLDLYKLVADGIKPLAELLSDPERLVQVLYALCHSQAEASGVSPEEFGSGMGGDPLEQASDALVEELVDFFPNPRSREALRKLLSKGRQVGQILLAQASERIDRLDPAEIARTLSESFGKSPEPSASTPAP